jgi:Acyl CoA binding protein
MKTDRVFAHALQTVRKIPKTGSVRPPPEDRLKLYGLYKQSMGAYMLESNVVRENGRLTVMHRGRCEWGYGAAGGVR